MDTGNINIQGDSGPSIWDLVNVTFISSAFQTYHTIEENISLRQYSCKTTEHQKMITIQKCSLHQEIWRLPKGAN